MRSSAVQSCCHLQIASLTRTTARPRAPSCLPAAFSGLSPCTVNVQFMHWHHGWCSHPTFALRAAVPARQKAGAYGVTRSANGLPDPVAAHEARGKETKTCVQCSEAYPLRYFRSAASTPDGLHVLCRGCWSQDNERRLGRPTSAPDAPRAASRKVCGTCRREMPMAHFSRNRRGADGHNPYCRTCVAHGDTRQAPHELAVAEQRYSKCRGLLPAGEFHKHKRSRTGLSPACRTCRKTRLQPYRHQPTVQLPAQLVCTACGLQKGINDFNVRMNFTFGRREQCKACFAILRCQRREAQQLRSDKQ